ncbi:MAG: hypothetical protein RLZZ157_1848, partial [Pseudomonadota bacterium]
MRMASPDRDDAAQPQLPIAVALVLCVLFACVIALLAKRDLDSTGHVAKQTVASEARVLAQQIDASLLSARASLVAHSASQTEALGGVIQAAPAIDVIAAFDGSGRITAQIGAVEADVGPLKAASLMARAEGWTGAIARGKGRYSPAIAVQTPNGGALVAFVSLPALNLFGGNRRVGVADGTGALIGAEPSVPDNVQGGARAVFGIAAPELAAGGTGQFGVDFAGKGVIVGAATSSSGLVAYVSQSKTAYDVAFYRSAIMFALLFLGPMLAFAGVWFLVTGQSERFEAARNQLRDAERRLRIAIEGASCGVWDWDVTEDRVYLTQRLAQTFGLRGAGRFPTARILQTLSEEDSGRMRAALTAAAQIGSLDVVLKVERPEGTTHVQLRGRAAVDRRQPNKVRVIGVSMDVSEERNTEARVAAAERRLRDAIDSISGPFALWSKERRLILWNGGFARTFGLDAGILRPGARYDEISSIAAKRVKSQRPDRYDEFAQEIELDNSVWIQMVERPTSDGGLVSIGIDISPLKETEESILQSQRQMQQMVTDLERSEQQAAELAAKYNAERQRAEEASSAKSGFLANMSHELRTPLNAINGFSEIMVQQLYGPLGDRRYHTYASDILDSGRHLLELINDVLDMAKVEAGKFKIYPKSMDLQETLHQAMRLVRGRAEEKSIAIETDIQDCGDFIGDARAIKQILINLLTNAIKFTPDEGRILVQVQSGFKDITIRII